MAEATEGQDQSAKGKILTYLRYIFVAIMGGLVLFIFIMAIYRKYWG
jgi:hypothetical protein